MMNKQVLKSIKVVFLLVCIAFLLVFTTYQRPDTGNAQAASVQNSASQSPQAQEIQQIYQVTGLVTYLRVNDVYTGFGPPTDFIDAEVIIRLDTLPNNAFGFTLRDDANRAAHTGMLNLLRDAYKNNWAVTIDYEIPAENVNNGYFFRLSLSK